jgi:hypothetical protein
MLTRIGLVGMRYSILTSKYRYLSLFCFLCGMACYIIATCDYDNYGMLTAGILVCVACLIHHFIGYILFMSSWIWYSMYMDDMICVPATFFLAMEFILAQEKIETPIIFISILCAVFLGERSNKPQKLRMH